MNQPSFNDRFAAAIAPVIAANFPESIYLQRAAIDAKNRAARKAIEDARCQWCEHCPETGHCPYCNSNH